MCRDLRAWQTVHFWWQLYRMVKWSWRSAVFWWLKAFSGESGIFGLYGRYQWVGKGGYCFRLWWKYSKKQAVINVGSAGTAARFLTAMLGFSGWRIYDRGIGADEKKTDAGIIFTAHRSWCKDYLSGNRRTFAGEDLWTEKSKSWHRSDKGRWNPTAVVMTSARALSF